MALRFLFLNLNSSVCLWFQCSEFGEGTDGGGKSDSNSVLPGLIASLYFHICVYRISISLFLCFFPRFLVASLSLSSPLYFDLFAFLSPFFLFLDKWVGAWKVTSPNSATYGILKKTYTWQYLKWVFLLTCQHLVKSFCFYILY